MFITVGDVQYHGGYHDACGRYREYHRGSSVLWGDTIFCNLSTVGVAMIHVGRYHEYCGGVQYCGSIQIMKDFPHDTEHPP